MRRLIVVFGCLLRLVRQIRSFVLEKSEAYRLTGQGALSLPTGSPILCLSVQALLLAPRSLPLSPKWIIFTRFLEMIHFISTSFVHVFRVQNMFRVWNCKCVCNLQCSNQDLLNKLFHLLL